MTLEQWTESNQVRAQDFDKPTYEPMKIVADRSYANRSELWHLSDYFVTSVEAGSIWLAKRKTPKE